MDLCVIVRWLNDNSAGVMAVATVVTMIATVFIAWATVVSSRLVGLEGTREQANRMPVLTLEEGEEGREEDKYRVVYIKNAGYGPALNITRRVIDPPPRLHIEGRTPSPSER